MSAGGRSVCSKLQLNKRWCAVCMGFSGQLQCGEGNLFILCGYERKLLLNLRGRCSCICCSFNDTARNSGYLASDNRVTVNTELVLTKCKIIYRRLHVVTE